MHHVYSLQLTTVSGQLSQASTTQYAEPECQLWSCIYPCAQAVWCSCIKDPVMTCLVITNNCFMNFGNRGMSRILPQTNSSYVARQCGVSRGVGGGGVTQFMCNYCPSVAPPFSRVMPRWKSGRSIRMRLHQPSSSPPLTYSSHNTTIRPSSRS